MAQLSRCVVLIALIGLLLALPALALDFPALSGRVVDDANILDPATRAALEQKLAALEAKTTDQLVVVTLKSLQGTSIEDYGYQLGRHWQIGQKGKNNGILLIVAPNDRKVRIEVGYGLEGTVTDAVSRLIIENAIIPRLRANDFAGGINRGVDDIVSALTGDAEEWKQRAAKRHEASPGGGFGDLLILLLIILMLVLIFRMMVGSMHATPQNRRRGSPGVIVWGPGWGSGSGDFGGGWSGGGGGGGFSGGGGSFGGGGASGSW